MIWQNYCYKDFSFSDLLGYDQRVVLTDVNTKIDTNTNIYNRANYHGTYSSKTLARGRLFTFKGVIFDNDPVIREQKWEMLNSIIQVSPNPWGTEFYPLSWDTKFGETRQVMAKVFTLPEATNGLWHPHIDFTFELYAENPWIFWIQENEAFGSLGVYGWTRLSRKLSNRFNAYNNRIYVVNNGNFDAPCKIEIVWPTQDVQILNLTNGTKLKLNGTTNNLIIDNRNLANDPKQNFVITDNGNNARYKRAWWWPITLAPWPNYISVSDLWHDSSTEITITWYDTYI